MFYAYKNISLIAGGMGGGVMDNIVITQVSKTGEVRHKLLGINSEKPTILAKLEDYQLP